MPLDQEINFQAILEKGNRLQVPQLFRWQYKMEVNQVLRVGVNVHGGWVYRQYFLAKMDKQGRILIPKLSFDILAKNYGSDLVGEVFDVSLQPA